MVTISFADRQTENRSLAFLLGRFSRRVLRSAEQIVPEAAMEALAEQGLSFMVKEKATYEQLIAALRTAASSTSLMGEKSQGRSLALSRSV